MADIARSAQEAGSIGRRKRNAGVEMGGSPITFQAGGSAPAHGLRSREVVAWLAGKRSNNTRLDQDSTIEFLSNALDARHDAAIWLVRDRQGGE